MRNKLNILIAFSLIITSVLLLTSCKQETNLPSQSSQAVTPNPQLTQVSKPEVIDRNTDIRALPGKLNNIPMINSNSPEWLKQEGILLSTFPATGKAFPKAHLGYPLTGKFELFDHHYILNPPESKTIYLGFLVHNPNKKPILLEISTAASNLIVATPNSKKENPLDGTRASDAILKGVKQPNFPSQLIIPPGGYKLIMNQPIETKGLERALNGRSSHIRFQSRELDTKNPALIYFASLAMYNKKETNGKTRSPNLQEWQELLEKGDLAKPRDKTPTPPQNMGGNLIYGRVSGVQQGTEWQTNLTDSGKTSLQIPEAGKSVSYVISTLQAGTFGTGQIQAANLLVRYPDTAYEAHGNYGVHYDLTAPLFNPTNQTQTVTIALETPLKSDNNQVLTFKSNSDSSAVFAGLVRLRYIDDAGLPIESYITVKQSRGQVVKPLLTLKLQPQETRNIRVDFLYPPDSTPPQVLTFSTNIN